MQQLTYQERAFGQLKRVPSFMIAFGMLAAFLFISTLITYSYTQPPPPPPIEAGWIEPDNVPKIGDIKDRTLVKAPPTTSRMPQNAPSAEIEGPQTDSPPSGGSGGPEDPPANPPPDEPIPTGPTGDVSVPIFPPTISIGPGPYSLPKEFRYRLPGTGHDNAFARGACGTGVSGYGTGNGTGNGSGNGNGLGGNGVAVIDKSIMAGLRWLKSVQEPDGSWSAGKWGATKESISVHQGVTGLALLAFLGNGCTDRAPQEFAGTVRKAIDYLMNTQASDGSFGWQGTDDTIAQMYAHGICTLAMSEAYGIMRNDRFKVVAEKALQFTFARQNENGGFGYSGPVDGRLGDQLAGTTDMSVSAFQFQGIKTAKIVGLNLPPETIGRMENYLRQVINSDYSTSYRPGTGQTGTFSMTAASLAVRTLWWGHANAYGADGQAKFLTGGKDAIDIARGVRSGQSCADPTYDLYTVYYTSLAMFQMGGTYWAAWANTYYPPLLSSQSKTGPDRGSWPTAHMTWGDRGGRVFTTAMGVLSLEAYFRYSRE